MTDRVSVLDGYRLTTAEILYRMPDCQRLLQSFVWQDYDLAPDFPRLHKFLSFWQNNLDGPLHSVRVAGSSLDFGLVNSYRSVTSEQRLH